MSVRGYRLAPEPGAYVVTDAEAEQMEHQGTATFLDRCAAEAAAARWFSVMVPRSPMRGRVLEALRQYGKLGALDLAALLRTHKSTIDRTVRELLRDDEIVVAGTAPTMGGPRIYAAREE